MESPLEVPVWLQVLSDSRSVGAQQRQWGEFVERAMLLGLLLAPWVSLELSQYSRVPVSLGLAVSQVRLSRPERKLVIVLGRRLEMLRV